MRVYERRPSGLSASQLIAHARRRPGAAGFTAARGVAGIALIGLAGAPLGVVWAAIGVVLLASVFLFVRDAAVAAVERPCLVLTGTPKWDGTRRTSWTIDADDALALAGRLAEGLDSELGDALTALDEGAAFRGTTRSLALAPDSGLAAIVAWGVDRPARLTADGDAVGVWIRVDAQSDDGRRAVTVLASDGRAVDALKLVAWRT